MPNEFHIKRLETQDSTLFQKLIVLFQEVFEMNNTSDVRTSYLKELLEDRYFIVYVALLEDQVIGGLTAYQLTSYYTESSEVFIYDIAVKPEYQRNGLGKKLLDTLKQYCASISVTELFVAAHEEDEHALDFYQATGGKAEKVVHFNFKI